MSLLKKVFRKKPKIDFSLPVFCNELLEQIGYDIEINRKFSSGMKRYATLDVTNLSDRQIRKVIGGIVREAEDFNICKLVQVGGFTKDDKRYIIVSGESHANYQTSTKNMMLDQMRLVTGGLPVEYVETHVTPPTVGESH